MKQSLQILKNKTCFKRHKYPRPNAFRPSATTIGGFRVSLRYPILNFKKMVCPKNVSMQHCVAKYLTDFNRSSTLKLFCTSLAAS